MANNEDGMSKLVDSCIKETAQMMEVPERMLHENLGYEGLRLLCITVARTAIADYLHKQYDNHLAQHPEFKPEHPGC